MVLAILGNRKSQTRRVIKEAAGLPSSAYLCQDAASPSGYAISGGSIEDVLLKCPYGVVGDRLWVRETFRSPGRSLVAYRADGAAGAWMGNGGGGRVWVHHGWIQQAADHTKRGEWYDQTKYGPKWIPSIFMRRWASRITLEVTAVRVEQVQQISTLDAIAEGIDCDGGSDEHRNRTSVENYRLLWDSINAARGYGWDTNPWVWVVEFRRVD